VTLTDELPSGYVAFLFTDIEGSTARWDADRAAMQEALRRHDAIVRAAIEANHGYVFKTMGDAFCAAFNHVSDALAAAIAAQRELHAQDWRAIDELLVRMAVHVGDSDERDGDYFGPTVNRVARLLSAGHGGQVLVSRSAANDAAPHLAADMGLRSLGILPLRGFREAERVFQLTAPGLRSAFKPLRALEMPPNNLPRQQTSFVGRQSDIAGVGSLLLRNSLVTIVGAGGIGKTRVALEAASDILEDMRGGAWFIDLAPISDPAFVASAMLSALGADQTSDEPLINVLLGYLNQRELLLVLDNCEHLVAEVARVTSAILASCPHVTILATSREPLNVTGEQMLRLSSLCVGDAITLFEERARTVNPSFRVSDANRAAVEGLCNRLDGIALAIELAAARMRAVSLEELSHRLELRVLTGGPRDRQGRQQTMRALVDWSYELLSEGERRLFRSVSVFAGGFTLDAASDVDAAAGEDSFDTLARLTSLVDKSLIVAESRDSAFRYRLLEPIREYARERLDESATSQDVLRRHSRALATIAQRAYEEFDTAPAPDWLSRNKLEVDNLRTALDWTLLREGDVVIGGAIAGSAGPIFLRLSQLREGVEWGERALRFASRLNAGVCARIHYTLSMLYHNQSAHRAALNAARYAVDLYRKSGDERGLIRALSQVAHHLDGDPVEARAIGDEAVRRARELGDSRLLAATLQRCALAYGSTDLEAARASFEECVGIFRSLGRDDETARALTFWATAEGVAGQWSVAAAIVREALELGGDDHARLYVTNQLAALYAALGETAQAAEMGREALRLAVENAHTIATPQAIIYLAAATMHSEPVQAACLFGYAKTQLQRLNWVSDSVDCAVETNLRNVLTCSLGREVMEAEITSGASWSESKALSVALRV
jgi:predicted ATPase/class 3 adenylate cyclase